MDDAASDSGRPAKSHPKPWTSHWAQLDGPVHYVDFGGEGPVVVCVHGLGGSYANWLGLAPLLARRARVLAVDLAGHGRTPAAGRRTDVRANQRLLDRFLTEVAGRPTVLVGNSMGGMISVMQASADPDTVAGLVLLNPALPRPRGVRPDPEIVRLFAGLIFPRLGELTLARRRARYTPEQMVADTMRRCTADPIRVPADLLAAQADVIRERARQPDIDKALVGAARSVVFALARPARLAAMVRTVRQPTLLVHGAADRLVPVGVARHVAAQRPDWRVEILDGFGHVPQMEDATATAEIISDWFALDGREAVRSARRIVAGVVPGAAGAAAGHPADEGEGDVSVIAPAILRPEPAEIGHPPLGHSNGSMH